MVVGVVRMGMYVSVRGWVELDFAQREAAERIIRVDEDDLYSGGWGWPSRHFNWTSYLFYGGTSGRAPSGVFGRRSSGLPLCRRSMRTAISPEGCSWSLTSRGRRGGGGFGAVGFSMSRRRASSGSCGSAGDEFDEGDQFSADSVVVGGCAVYADAADGHEAAGQAGVVGGVFHHGAA